MQVTDTSLLIAHIMHERVRPKHNKFNYRTYYLCFPLSGLHTLKRVILSLERFNLFSYYQRDHGDAVKPNHDWIRDILQEWRLSEECNGDIMLVTMPRILGYAFNPVSFWFCLDTQQQIRAVLSEVNNTFGEAHCYLSFHDDRRAIMPQDELFSRKVFHVSPFMKIEGQYRYRFALNADAVNVQITHENEKGVLLYTSLKGTRQKLTTAKLLYCFVRFPLVTFKVTTLIYWQALKLFGRKIHYHRKPEPPHEPVTR